MDCLMRKLTLFLLCGAVSFTCVCHPFFWRRESRQVQVPIINIFDPIDFETSVKSLLIAMKQTDVAGVILIINSNGGGLGEFSVLHDIIKKVAAVKPVVCLIAACAQSCGYLLASAGNFVFAHSLSEIGAIGVIRSNQRYKNARIKGPDLEADYKVEVFSAGEFKAAGNLYADDLTDSQRTFWQTNVQKLYDNMLELIATNRELDKSTAKDWAEGKFFDAKQAIELGLIDEVGTILEAEEKIKELIQERDNRILVENILFVE